MDQRGRKLLGIFMIVSWAGVLLGIGASITFEYGHRGISLILFVVAVSLLAAGQILSRMHDKISRAQLNTLRQMMDSFAVVPAQESDYPWLDSGKLCLWTSDLSSLGFTSLGDFTVGVEQPAEEDIALPESFVRVMASSKNQCFAEIGQKNKAGKGITYNIVSFFASGQQCRTDNAAANPLADTALASVQPESFTFHAEGASPAELLQIHLQQRDKLVSERGLVVSGDVSLDAYKQQTMNEVNKIRGRFGMQVGSAMRQ